MELFPHQLKFTFLSPRPSQRLFILLLQQKEEKVLLPPEGQTCIFVEVWAFQQGWNDKAGRVQFVTLSLPFNCR